MDEGQILGTELRIALERTDRGENQIFLSTIGDQCSTLRYPDTIVDPVLRAVWSMADEYFYTLDHDETTVNDLPVGEARRILADAANKLENGLPIVDQYLLAFAEWLQKKKKPWWARLYSWFGGTPHWG